MRAAATRLRSVSRWSVDRYVAKVSDWLGALWPAAFIILHPSGPPLTLFSCPDSSLPIISLSSRLLSSGTMAQAHEEAAAELHEAFAERVPNQETDLAGGYIAHPDLEDDKKGSVSDVDVAGPTPDGEEPTEREKATLKRVGENLPASAFMIAVVELMERFTFYGASGLFQNYINNGTDGQDGSIGLGLGNQAATGLNLFFQWFCYVTPILGAIIADQYLGRYKTIVLFCGVYWVGLALLWTTSLPAAVAHGAGLPGYIVSIIIIGFGTGGIKSNIAPLIADQYQRRTMAIRTEASGERVIIDPAITYQRIYMIFYWAINLGSLSLIATPFMEKYKGFWTAYLLCFCAFNVGIVILIALQKKYVVRPPQGSVITDAFKAIGLMIAGRTTEAAKPSWRAANGKTKQVPWNDHFVDELKRALRACKVFAFYPFFWVCYGQFNTNFITQAGQMNGHGMPNDFMQNFDPISILIFVPVLDRLVYPPLRKAGIELKPIMRISIGFMLAALCMAYAAIVQHLVYQSGPCYDNPLNCPAALAHTPNLPNNIHIAVQSPAYVFIGLSEIFISVTGLEYAYTKSPPSMKSFVQSLYLFTNAFGSAINEALNPVLVNPKFLWMYTGVACFTAVIGVVFYFLFRHYDDDEEKMYDLDRDEPELTERAAIGRAKQTKEDEEATQ
ncbi:POT family protein [Acrodontium crateriforme]|uniref:POT family protein n=1 Tax=Acrodontium crateriforme TaxID=150365 RepID=A0AAQ3M7Q3_9PEZI|nr:POT family protein [Acrodontium crateriforme]